MMNKERFIKPKIDKYIQLYSRNARVEEGVFTKILTGVKVDNGGAGYLSNLTASIIGGGGTGATCSVAVSNGVITGATLTNAGTGYTSLPNVILNNPLTNSVKSIEIVNGGSGYFLPPTILIDEPPTIILRTAQGTAVTDFIPLQFLFIREVLSVTITDGGQGYQSPPRVVFTGGGGTGAIGTPVINASGVITSITITNAGSGYTSAPAVSIIGTGGGTGAVATCTVSGGLVNSITVTNGGVGYSSTTVIPAVALVSSNNRDGSNPAHATAVVVAGAVTAINITFGGEYYSDDVFVSIADPISVSPNVATATCTILNGSINTVTITNEGAGYLEAPSISIVGGGIGAQLQAYLQNGHDGALSVINQLVPTTARRFSWELKNPIELNENGILQIVDRVYSGAGGSDPFIVRLHEISSQSIHNTKNISTNANINEGMIIDIAKSNNNHQHSDIMVEINTQTINRIVLSVDRTLSTFVGIPYSMEFLIIMKIEEKEPTQIEFGTLNNINSFQLQ